MYQVQKAKREKIKASIICEGLQGSGKSVAALMFAYAFAKKDHPDVADVSDYVGAVDTENRSLNLLVGRDFDTLKVGEFLKVDLTDNFSPQNYKLAGDALINAGATSLIYDSYTHMWAREGGVLDQVSEIQASGHKNSYTAWGKEEVREGKELIYRLMRNPNAHVISTIRVKEKQAVEQGSDGKTQIVSLGEQQVMQEGLKYEPDLVLRFSAGGHYKVLKSRYAIFPLDSEGVLTMSLCEDLADYLGEGVDPEEIFEKQRADYLNSMQALVQSNPTAKMLFDTIMASDYAGQKIKEMDLKTVQAIYFKVSDAVR